MKERIVSNEEKIRRIVVANLDSIIKYHKNAEFFEKNFKEIRKEHAGKKVIVVDDRVRNVTPKAFDELRKKNKLPEAFISYVPAKGEILML